MEILLNEKSKKKIQLFTELLYRENEEISFSYLQNFLGVSISTLKRYFQELSIDIKNNKTLKHILLIRNVGGYVIRNHSAHDMDYLIIQLRLSYFEESLQFKIFLELLLNHYNSVEDLAEKLYISPPHLYKNINILNIELERYPLKIVFNPTTNFEGKEKYIRMLNFYFFWSVYRGIAWPYDFQNMKHFSENVDFGVLQKNYSDSVIKRLEFMVGLFMVRQDNHPIRLPKKIKELSKHFATTNAISKLVEPFLATEDEILFFNLLARCYISEIDTLQDKYRLYDSFPRSLPLISACDLLIEEYEKYFYKDFSMNKEQKTTLFYSLLIGMIQATYFSISPIQFFRTAFIENMETKLSIKDNPKVNHFYKKFREENPDFPLPTHSDFGICILLTILTETFLCPTLSIYIKYSRNSLGSVYIENKLHMLFNPRAIHYTDCLEKADLVIIDCFEDREKKNNQKFFYISDVYNEQTWHELFTCIQTLFFKAKSTFY
ncbi:helix-turn-helix domain-containing protein [Candidatus Enterococcus ikei]|uniref:Helix-turn-helix domain-containing protein n=1 Tax=Candidatus Enterococcus ikei TaxID=2815326 RepID=A0ABS3GY97_9ENTE|nr:helix-turn-helix domain-containing protein [Enterococcus sp. DIV0869a]MBO0440239.1 helix-turn-helix domain-containing protein [Enterococcus sp. DIV0869a]